MKSLVTARRRLARCGMPKVLLLSDHQRPGGDACRQPSARSANDQSHTDDCSGHRAVPDCRLGSPEHLVSELRTWCSSRNADQSKVLWTFTTRDPRPATPAEYSGISTHRLRLDGLLPRSTTYMPSCVSAK
jgi:hypothetical protein